MNRAKAVFDKDFVIGEVDKRISSSFIEHLGRCVYDGIYEPGHKTADSNGFREDVKELVRELGVTAIRYPGGNFVSGYNWKDGVGPIEHRPRKKELAWNTIETNQVGINEFARWLDDIGVGMIMTANLGSGTPMEAGELVDYCNNQKGTH
ncbi:MAG TPA: alpha-N-arabinofuranosidase, partial [Halanaerobiales bacterium]|nr:alpha-N-arabinofuranosidase [Halanaerobiales bacterium]